MDIEQNPNQLIDNDNDNDKPYENGTDVASLGQNGGLPDDYSTLTSLEKITHVNAKVRAHFYETILEEIERQGAIADPDLVNYIRHNMDMLMAETLIENQKLVLRLCFRMEQHPAFYNSLDISKKAFWYNFLDKFLSSSKSFIKDDSWRLFELLFVRIDKSTFIALGLDFLTKNNLKINKIILSIFNNKFELFEAWQANLSQILPLLDKLLLNPNPELRNGAITLLKHLSYAFSLEILKNMKNVKTTHLEDIRAFLISKGSSANNGGLFKGSSIESISHPKKTVDLFKISEPVSIVAKFNDVWAEKVLSTQKWSDKKEMMDSLIKAGSVPRLQADNYSHLIGLAKRLLSDSNMQVQICGIKVFGMIAKGLRSSSRQYIRPNITLLISKFKDKKAHILDAVQSAVADCFYCLSVDDLYEEVKMFNTQRNKDIRINVLRMTQNLFEFLHEREQNSSSESKSMQSFIKSFGELLNIYYEDPDIEVRKMTNDVVLKIQDVWRDSNYWDALIKVVDLSKIKIKERIERLNATPTKSEMVIERGNDRNISPLKISKSHMAKITKSHEKKARDQRHVSKLNPKEVLFYSFKPYEILEEEAKAYMCEVFGGEIIQNFLSQNTKTKVEALKEIIHSVKGMDTIRMDQRFINSTCTLVRKELRDFKESNILLVKEAFDLFEVLFQKLDSIEDIFGHFSLLITRKLTETKFKLQIQSIMRNFKRKLSFHKMIHILLYHNDIFVNPKLLGEIFSIGLEYFDADSTYMYQDLKKLIIPGLNNSNQGTRTSAVSFLKALAPYISSSQTKEIINGVENPTLSKQLNQEILPLIPHQEQNPSTINPFQTGLDEELPERKPQKNGNRDSSMNPSIDETTGNGRRKLSNDISRKINANSVQDIIAGLSKPDWKTRKDAVEIYTKYLENTPSMFSAINVNETFQNLNLRLQDSSRPVAVATIIGIRSLLDSHFVQFKPFYRILINTFLENLSDKNVCL